MALISGAAAKNPQRYRARKAPLVAAPVGTPPKWLRPGAAAAWRDLASEIPWLNSSHRAHLAITAVLHANLAAGALSVSGMQLLDQCLRALCATPVAAAKIPAAADDDDDDDLLE